MPSRISRRNSGLSQVSTSLFLLTSRRTADSERHRPEMNITQLFRVSLFAQWNCPIQLAVQKHMLSTHSGKLSLMQIILWSLARHPIRKHVVGWPSMECSDRFCRTAQPNSTGAVHLFERQTMARNRNCNPTLLLSLPAYKLEQPSWPSWWPGIISQTIISKESKYWPRRRSLASYLLFPPFLQGTVSGPSWSMIGTSHGRFTKFRSRSTLEPNLYL